VLLRQQFEIIPKRSNRSM